MEIIINTFKFKLIEKTTLSNGYIVVRIQSFGTLFVTNKPLADFWVYRSNSELGFWRLCSSVSDNPEQMYKGDPDEFNYDYIQTTFIHLTLQFFINARFGEIPPITDIDPNGMDINTKNKNLIKKHELLPHIAPNGVGTETLFILSKTLSISYKTIVDDENRIIQERPFIDIYNEAKCGEQLNITNLQEFSGVFQSQYTVDSDIPFDEGKYNYEFERIIKIDGQINCITLTRNIPDAGQTNNIELYYLNARLCELQNTSTSEFDKNIEYVCREDKHIMPFLLIPVGTPVNILGLYSKYILAGAYVCKLFDYAVQCSPKENKRRQCTINYTHIGYRYNDLFPFTIEQPNKKRRARGTTKKGNQSKRKTRKQQNKERNKRKEINKRKERRSKNKNKNKSKKYGARSL
jgi:hypothetical protein